jgi:hypothetical protein
MNYFPDGGARYPMKICASLVLGSTGLEIFRRGETRLNRKGFCYARAVLARNTSIDDDR